MIRILISIITSLLGVFAFAQVKSTFTLSQAIHEIEVSSLIKVYVDSQADAMEIDLAATYPEGLERIKLTQQGGKLLIRIKNGQKATKGKELDGIEVRLSQRAINKYTITSMANVVVEGTTRVDQAFITLRSMGKLKLDIQAKEVTLDVASQATFSGAIEAEELKAEVASMGKVTVEGTVEDAKIVVTSQAKFLGSQLKVKRADVSAVSMGKIEVAPVEYLNASALSMAKVIYVTRPIELVVNTSSMGKVKLR